MKELKHIRNRIRSRHGDRNFFNRPYQKSSIWYRLLVSTMVIVLLVLGSMTLAKTPVYDDILKYASNIIPGLKTTLSTSFLTKWLPFESWFASADTLPVVAQNMYEAGTMPGYYTNESHEAKVLYDGLVVYIGEEDDSKWVVVHHDNSLYATYGNLDSVRVKLYDRVLKDMSVGSFGSEIQLEFLYDSEEITYEQALQLAEN